MTRRDIILGSASVAALLGVGGWAPAIAELGRADDPLAFRNGLATTARHATAYLECGPGTGPLMILLHGFPETAIVWREVMVHVAARGWRCVAPDMRGYGGSSVPTRVGDYTDHPHHHSRIVTLLRWSPRIEVVPGALMPV